MSTSFDVSTIAAMPIAWPRRLSPKAAIRAFITAHPDFEGRVWVWTLSRAKARYREFVRDLRWRERERWTLWVVDDGEVIRLTHAERQRRRQPPYPLYGDVIVDITNDVPRVGVWARVGCAACNGTGETRSGRNACLTCRGDGVVDGVRWLS